MRILTAVLTIVAIWTVGSVQPVAAGAVRPLQGFTAQSLPEGDDVSSGPVPLGFTASFFGVPITTVFVNNNGNVTFDAPLSDFTPFDFTATSRQIIAPFFADVDRTTNSGTCVGDGCTVCCVDLCDSEFCFSDLGLVAGRQFPAVGTAAVGTSRVEYGYDVVLGRRAFGVNWIGVGFYFRHQDKLNSFQLVLIDRSDTGPGNVDVEFNYDQIQWETGDASGGVGGLGGSSARVGFSNGTRTPGTFFEGPGSGINGAFLDTAPDGGLVGNRLNSEVSGRYFVMVRGGVIVSQSVVTVTKAGTGSGTVRGPGIDCGTTCSADFTPGAHLTATAAPGSSFAGWSGGCAGTGLCILPASGETTVTATFVRVPRLVGAQTAGANNPSLNPAVSADGRFVAFDSAATNLTGDCATGHQVFVRDRTTEVTTCVSVSPSGLAGNGTSEHPAFSADGRFVVFRSTALNLADPCATGVAQVFRRDLLAGTTACVSLDTSGIPGDGASGRPAISSDGSVVGFESAATNLAGSCTTGSSQIFVRDLAGGTTTCASISTAGIPGNGSSTAPALSANARFVAFESTATNLADPCTTGTSQVFFRDLAFQTTRCASVGPEGAPPDAASGGPALSADGNLLAFDSGATNLALPCNTGVRQVFIRLRITGVTRCATVDANGFPGSAPSSTAALSGNGRRLAYSSGALNLSLTARPNRAQGGGALATETNQILGSDVDPRGDVEPRVSPPEFLSESETGAPGLGSSTSPALNSEGSVTAFGSTARNLAPGTGPTDNVVVVQPRRVRITTPAQGSGLFLDTPATLAFSWTALPGAARYGIEFTGPNRQFANPNGNGPDAVNGAGGAGGGFLTAATSLAGSVGPGIDIPPGLYQFRVIGVSAAGEPIGEFSDALTLVLGFSGRPAFISPANGAVLTPGATVTFAWIQVPGAVQYGLEFTGANRPFSNPNGMGPDPVNGFGGAGGATLVTGTAFTVTLPPGIPSGSYQIRVIGLSATGLVGVFSDAVTVVFP